MGEVADDEGFRQRIREAIQAGGGVPAMAERTGIPKKTLEKYLAKSRKASFANAAKIAEAANIPLSSLIENAPKPAVDAAVELVRLAGEAVMRIYKEEGVHIPPPVLPNEIARFYAGLLADERNGEDTRRRVDDQAARLRSELREAAAAPGTGKREAS